jgi:hypothetical protein
VLRGISGPKRDEVLHSKNLQNLYSLQNMIRVIKSRRMGWVKHAACLKDMRTGNTSSVVNLKGRHRLAGLGRGQRAGQY